MSKPLRLLSLELGSTDSGRMVIEELRLLVPEIWIAGVEKLAHYKNSVFDLVVTTQYDAFLGRYQSVNTADLPMTPELSSQMAPHEGKLLNLLGLAGVRAVNDYPDPIRGVPVFRESYEARKDLLDRHIRFWSFILDEYQIDAVIHENLGQEGYDYVALQVARSKNIPTLVFNIAGQFPRVQFVQESESGLGDFELGSKLKSRIGSELQFESPEFIRRSIDRIQNSPDAGLMTRSSISDYATSPLRSWLFDRSIYENSSDYLYILRRLARKLQRFLKNPQQRASVFLRSLTLVQSTRRSMREEKRHAISPNLTTRYIYFPLHFQPETSTSIKANHFYRLREAVAFLANGLPSGWSLIVKEHPHQFRRLLKRERGFYAQIAAISNVQLVLHSTENGRLVAGAQAVACVSHSSITAHAITTGTPVISLGDSHFREAPGYFCVKSTADLTFAIRAIENNSPEIRGDFDNFVSRLEQSTFEGEFGEKFSDVSDEEWQRTIQATRHNISRVIREWLRIRNLAS